MQWSSKVISPQHISAFSSRFFTQGKEMRSRRRRRRGGGLERIQLMCEKVWIGAYVVLAITAKDIFGKLASWGICAPYPPPHRPKELCKPFLNEGLGLKVGRRADLGAGWVAYSCGIPSAVVNIQVVQKALSVGRMADARPGEYHLW